MNPILIVTNDPLLIKGFIPFLNIKCKLKSYN